jgi:hypothetical protein
MPRARSRRLVHTRRIAVEAFLREDGLWDLEARLADLKSRDFPLVSGVRLAGEPVHDMLLTVTINRSFEVVAARAETNRMPYPGACDQITPAYEKLVGLNLLKGFKKAATERLGGVDGCTHMTELTAVLPTAAVQAFAGEKAEPNADDTQKPFQLDRCHAMRTDGEAVRQFYPKWFRGVQAAA